ncbi:hypothetical protein VCV18_012057 [Metarhizium anisopliae]
MNIPRWAKIGLCITGALMIYHANTFAHKRYGKVKYLETHPLRVYGDGTCADNIRISQGLIEKAKTMRQQCQDSASPLRTYGSWGARIATVTTHFSGPDDPQRFYQKAIETHILHNLVHGSQLHVLCTPIIDHMWNKQAFIQFVLLSELAKPPQERLEWIFWADRDTIPWLNTYAWDNAQDFMSRKDVQGLDDWASRRGDFLIHFAGNEDKELNIVEYSQVGDKIFNIWETRDMLRDVSMDIERFWGNRSNGPG